MNLSRRRVRSRSSRSKMHRASQLQIESLEGRSLLAVVPVTYGDLNGWNLNTNNGGAGPVTAVVSFVSGPATPPLPPGSGQLAVGSNGDGAAQFRTTNYDGKLLSTLTSLSYSTYVQQDGSGGQAPYLRLDVDFDNNGTTDDSLFFEPVYQSSTYFPSNPQGPLAVGTWQTWNALTGGWWSNNNTAGAGPGTDVKSLATILAAEPAARFSTVGTGAMRLVAGTGAPDWNNFVGNVDNVTVGVSGSDITYDFGTQPPITYVDDNWVGVTPGTDPDGVGPAQNFGFDSFATIQGGVDGVATNGTVIVYAGTYSELVQVDKTVSLLGAQAGVDARTRTAVPESIVGSGDGAFQILANNVKIDGFTVQGVTNDPSMAPFTGLGAGIWTNPGFSGTNGGHQILNNIIQNNISGLELANDGTYQTVVKFNLFQNNNAPGAGSGDGIRGDFNLDNALVDSNKFVNQSERGILIFGASNSTFSNNDIDGRGIGIGGGSNLNFTGNNIHGGGTTGISLTLVTNAASTENTITGKTLDGIRYVGSTGSILRNTLTGNVNGVLLDASTADVKNNFITGGTTGVSFANSGSGMIFNNDLSGNSGLAVNNGTASLIDASGNWFGTNTAAGVAAKVTAGLVDYTPWLNSGTDTDLVTAGFQGDFSFLNVDDNSPQSGAVGRIQEGVNLAADGLLTGSNRVVNVLAGAYSENIVLNKSVMLLGAQAGVDARGRVLGVANPAVETVLTTASGTILTLVTNSANSKIDGFAFSGGVRAIESTSGPIDGVQILNNDFRGSTNSEVFLNDNGLNITVNQNSLDGTSQTGGDLFHLDTDNFNGFQFTNNWVKNRTGGTGFFVDGNHNVGPSVLRNPLISGNVFDNNQTGANLGTRAFGSLTVANAGTISLNTFSNSGFDGLQGGMQNVLITRNAFSTNGRSGLALTSFGNTGADRGAQNTLITENFFSGNVSEDVLFSASQAAGTIATNRLFDNSLLSARSVTYNGTEIIQASGNWWGANTNPEFTGTKIGGTGAANVDYSPWLDVGTDTSVAPGFQGSFAVLNVDDDSPVSGQIQEGIGLVAAGGLVNIFPGTYSGNVNATSKAVVLAIGPGVTTAIVTINGTFTLDADDTLRFELNGLTPGTQYDQLIVNGSTSLGGATAAIDRNFIVPIGQKLTLIDGVSPMTGTFAGLPNNMVSVIDGQPFTVRYGDVDGGDFTIQPSETPPVVIVDGKLLVSGTDGNDKIYIYQSGSTKLYVKINGKVYGPYNPAAIACVIVYGKNGNDYIEAQSSLKKPVELHGDAGNDTLLGSNQNDLLDGGIGNDIMKGGNGDDRMYGGDGTDQMWGGNGCDVLVGGAGGDTIYGDAGNDIIIGGLDWDHLKGGANDDVVISGTTLYDDGATNAASDAALKALSAEWCSKRTYDQRITNMTNGSLGAKLVVGATVCPSDGSRDFLRGEAGRDWFFTVTNKPDQDDLDSDRVAKGPNVERKDGSS